MARISFFVSAFMFINFFLSGCSGDGGESKSMEQLYQEQGVPVKVEKLENETFIQEFSFHSAFSGLEESSEYASFGGRVEKIHATVGEFVQKGQLIVSFPTDNPAANYYQTKTAYENAKAAYERLKNLKQTGGVSQQSFDNAEMQYNMAKANWDVVRKSVQVVAPISGIITKISVSETENVKKEAELFTVSKINKLKATVWITEKEISDVKEGMPVRAVWQDKELKGTVVRVNMAMNERTQAFEALLVFDNPENYPLLGITVEMFIEVYRTKTLVIDHKNIRNENGGSYVFVNENGKAAKRNIKTGRIQGLKQEVVEGLHPGDELITEGIMLIEDGTKIRIVK